MGPHTDLDVRPIQRGREPDAAQGKATVQVRLARRTVGAVVSGLRTRGASAVWGKPAQGRPLGSRVRGDWSSPGQQGTLGFWHVAGT